MEPSRDSSATMICRDKYSQVKQPNPIYSPSSTPSRTPSTTSLPPFPSQLQAQHEADQCSSQQDLPSSLPPSEESLTARLKHLGSVRPSHFPTLWSEIIFVFSICMSQVLLEFFVSGFNIILPTLITALNIPAASSVWPATAYSLVIASTLTIFGRLGDMYGGYPVYLFGLGWLAIWSIVAGFSTNALMLDIIRALMGFGPAAFLPASVQLIGSVYRPGPRKNLVFAIYGGCSVGGFYMGVFFAGLVAQAVPARVGGWGWYFWIGAILSAIAFVTSWFSVKNDFPEKKLQRESQSEEEKLGMDYYGAITIVCGSVLVVFAITQSANVPNGWRTPYVPTLLVVGILFLLAAVYIECRVATQPLLPPSVFAVKGMAPLLISLFLLYGTVANFLLYGVQYFTDYMSASPLQITAWFTPMAIGGLILVLTEGLLLHIIPGYYLLVLSGIGAIGAQLLLALIPLGGNYWAWILPSMILATIGIDLSITLMMVFVTTHLPLKQQGLGGGLVNSSLNLGAALIVGASDIVRSETEASAGPRGALKNTFWFGVAMAGLSMALMLIWGRVIKKQKSDLTEDERRALIKDDQVQGL